MVGPDISGYQTLTDPNAVAGWADFVICKLGDGKQSVSVKTEHAVRLKAAGENVGGYFFGRRNANPEACADQFAQTLYEIDALDTAAFLDLEYVAPVNGVEQYGFLKDAHAKDWAIRFLLRLIEWRVRPGIYMNEDYARYFKPDQWGIPDLIFWIANYSRTPAVPWHIHQHTSTGGPKPGVVSGTPNGLDMNHAQYDVTRRSELPFSQNGYSANDVNLTQNATIPGTTRKIRVRKGPAGELLLWFAGQFDKLVEDIEAGQLDDWGYAERPIKGGTALSNHASGTAIDLNAPKHPLGARGTFSKAQVDRIHGLLNKAQGCIRWGGDYSGRADEMHFEINKNESACAKALVAVTLGDTNMASLEEIQGKLDYLILVLGTRWQGDAPNGQEINGLWHGDTGEVARAAYKTAKETKTAVATLDDRTNTAVNQIRADIAALSTKIDNTHS